MSWDRVALAMTIGCAACAGATSRAGQARCVLTHADSAYLASAPVYRDCAVDRRARLLTTAVRPEFSPSSRPAGGTACYSAQIEFVVDSAGVPELATARVVRTNNPSFADAVLATVPGWRYLPALKNGIPVRQIVRENQSMAVQVMQVRAGDVPRPGRAPRC